MQEPGTSASTFLGILQGLVEKLAEANNTIATLPAELGTARAQIEAGKEMLALAVKATTMEAKQEAQAEMGAVYVERQSLREGIAKIEDTWEQWHHSAEAAVCSAPFGPQPIQQSTDFAMEHSTQPLASPPGMGLQLASALPTAGETRCRSWPPL